MEVMCYDSSSTRVFIQSEKKKKATNKKNSAIHRNETARLWCVPFFSLAFLFFKENPYKV